MPLRFLRPAPAALGLALLLTAVGFRAGAAPGRLSSQPETWPSWRGPTGQGYSDDTRVPLVWSATHNLLWTCDLPGQGDSSPVVWGDHIFLTAAADGGKERRVLCVRATDGKLLWQRTAGQDAKPGKSHPWNGYATPTCVTDGKYVFAFFGTPGLFCYDFDGNLVWQHSFGLFTNSRSWGVAASPVLFEDLVIQNCDNDGAAGLAPGQRPEAAPVALVALDKVTGKVRWQAERDQGHGYSTPVFVPTPEGRLDLVLNSPQGVWAYDPHTGKEVWHVDRKGEQARFGEPSPAFGRDTLYETSGRPGPMQAIRLGGAGDLSRTHLLWQVERKGHRDVSSPILWGDLLYAADNRGILTCYEAQTGKTVYEQKLGAKSLASPLSVRGKLLFLLDDGVTAVLEPGRQFKVVGRNKLGDGNQLEFIASPAVAAGRLFLRSQSRLYCVSE